MRTTLAHNTPLTIVVPKIIAPADTADDAGVDANEPQSSAIDRLFEHIVPGVALGRADIAPARYGNLNQNPIVIAVAKASDSDTTTNVTQWTVNGQAIVRMEQPSESVSIVFIDGTLDGSGSATAADGERKAAFAKRNIQDVVNRYNAPQRLVQRPAERGRPSALVTWLAGMKSGTKVFQHFLNKSKLTQELADSTSPDGQQYTILIPTDSAFQRWHPIDWGFYPFSVPEFTESVLRNHFLQLRQPLRMSDVRQMEHGAKYKTLGGDIVVFRNNRESVCGLGVRRGQEIDFWWFGSSFAVGEQRVDSARLHAAEWQRGVSDLRGAVRLRGGGVATASGLGDAG